jgi:prevent-host-death family protein
MKTVGAYEAKTHLPALLEEVSQGATIMITKHGRPVAMLTPIGAGPRMTKEEALAGLKELRTKYSLGGISAKELIDEGRKY